MKNVRTQLSVAACIMFACGCSKPPAVGTATARSSNAVSAELAKLNAMSKHDRLQYIKDHPEALRISSGG